MLLYIIATTRDSRSKLTSQYNSYLEVLMRIPVYGDRSTRINKLWFIKHLNKLPSGLMYHFCRIYIIHFLLYINSHVRDAGLILYGCKSRKMIQYLVQNQVYDASRDHTT